jgi:membrane-associated phospholipid phosphatase
VPWLMTWPLGFVLAGAIASTPAPIDPSSDFGPQASAPIQAANPARETSGADRFVRDVGGDYRAFFSRATGQWLSIGLGGIAAVHAGDPAASDGSPRVLRGGQEYGDPAVQAALAVGWWIAGVAGGHARAASAGRDLVRAQISAASWTFGLKLPINRTRPNGEGRSFPSGHTTTTVATAMVLAEHYGWKLGAPALAAAGYTAWSRVAAHRHWLSDVTFGAFLGLASARTVTRRLRAVNVAVTPWPVPGGGGVLVRATR